MKIAQDFLKLLPKLSREPLEPGEPLYYLWVFDPIEDKVILEHNEGKHHAEHLDHSDLAKRVDHPDRIHGFAYCIEGGFRITDWEHRPLDDEHIKETVRLALKGRKNKKHTDSQVQSRAV